MTVTTLLLTPSRGRGGGIERYVETVEWALGVHSVAYCRIDLDRPGVSAHGRLLAEGRRLFETDRSLPERLILAHRSLLPVAGLLARGRPNCEISVLCHGVEVWAARPKARRVVEDRLMQRSNIRVVAVSNFTAGALLNGCQATILPPGLSAEWFSTLVGASSLERRRDPAIHLVTAFRLADFRSKGLPELVEAIARLGRPDVQLTVCGSGRPPAELSRLIDQRPWCSLRSGLSDEALARELAAADLFVLATRTRGGHAASGEGFGLVLLEAQVAGTAVVGPAFGGSHEAFLHCVTGEAPVDETAESLSDVLDRLLKDPARLRQMGMQAARWARECFAPDIYAARVVRSLL
jgi:phosphatidyl-myo-inositol dimannoside synthase